MADTTEIPVWGDELLDLMRIDLESENAVYHNVSNLINWSFGDDQKTYEPSYIDTRKEKKFILGQTASIEYEKDLYKNNALDAFLVEVEDKTNVPIEIVRVETWNDNKAKMARFLLTPQQLDKSASGEPIKLKGTCTMSDNDWTYGKWQDNTFVPDGADTGIADDNTQTTPSTDEGTEQEPQG